MDFSHLSKYQIDDQTAEYELPIEGDPIPTLIVRPANEANKTYYNKVFASSTRRALRASKVNAKALAEQRDEDRELYPLHVVVGWRGIRDSSGADVPFSQENCAEFLRVLPDWIFQGLRNFCASPSVFLGDRRKNS
jgi:hypothetical protein